MYFVVIQRETPSPQLLEKILDVVSPSIFKSTFTDNYPNVLLSNVCSIFNKIKLGIVRRLSWVCLVPRYLQPQTLFWKTEFRSALGCERITMLIYPAFYPLQKGFCRSIHHVKVPCTCIPLYFVCSYIEILYTCGFHNVDWSWLPTDCHFTNYQSINPWMHLSVKTDLAVIIIKEKWKCTSLFQFHIRENRWAVKRSQ